MLNIKEVESIFQVKYKLYFNWFDDRLTYENLKNDTDFNTFSPVEKRSIWTPELLFDNTEYILGTVVDSHTYIAVRREGVSSEPSDTEYQIVQHFKGSENMLISSRTYNTRFLCNYNMAMFPFDIQKCNLIFKMKGTSRKFVDLKAHLLKFLGPTEHKQYAVTGCKMEVTKFQGQQILKVEVMLERKLLGLVLTIFFPTLLLNIISYFTSFFGDSFFPVAVTVNLTSMLVLTTLFVSVSNKCQKMILLALSGGSHVWQK